MLDKDIDSQLLRAFVTVAELGSFTRAATKLYRTQSAVSMQVRRLEQQLGKKLLARSSRQVTLTSLGEMVLPYARRILRIQEAMLNEVGQEQISGKVRLGMPDDYAAYFLPQVLSHFGLLYPNIQMEIFCELSRNLEPMVHSGEIDLAVVTRHPENASGRFVRREQLVWVEDAQAFAHEQQPLPLALFPEGYCAFRLQALKALENAGTPWRIICESRGLAGIRATVSAGLAVTVVTRNTLSPTMRIIGPEQGLPDLPEIEIGLLTPGWGEDEATDVLASHILESLRHEGNGTATPEVEPLSNEPSAPRGM
ncbi:LysR substrate-binding domain-containing protein [Desulfohalobium retbaense]|uniref:Transcriptional regulator, LysR family n=1 Tax=Desulfohalobium retbaense (strain ATCC 49708 / DSM 5692 / JCM 16813 / HR100) TaxID=485915 RepID=C8X2B4_DESRD|nr:LysR substrate-binding domain-containing protein [Desulfohalobium retbaense]ACV68561.1 transcriptional regulator, LysR family [Desulfohalobium retbaense DSM 5692]